MIQEQGFNELGLYDIYQQWHVPFWHTTIFYVIIGAVILGISLVLFRRLIIKYKLKKENQECWDVALNQIDYLQKNNYARIEQGKEFYCALTDILKRYMHARYGFDGIEKTDQEFLRYLERQNFSPLFMQDLTAIFEGSTTIKFANASAAQQQIDHDLAVAISFIKRTIPSKSK